MSAEENCGVVVLSAMAFWTLLVRIMFRLPLPGREDDVGGAAGGGAIVDVDVDVDVLVMLENPSGNDGGGGRGADVADME